MNMPEPGRSLADPHVDEELGSRLRWHGRFLLVIAAFIAMFIATGPHGNAGPGIAFVTSLFFGGFSLGWSCGYLLLGATRRCWGWFPDLTIHDLDSRHKPGGVLLNLIGTLIWFVTFIGGLIVLIRLKLL